jgi:hypothetical protein
MSFSVYVNSVNGTQVAGAQSQIQYNFDWRNTPAHDGAYKVHMTFASEQQTYASGSVNFGRVNVDLGVADSFTPVNTSTQTRNNQVLGFIRGSPPQFNSTNSIPSVTSTSSATIPNNAGTVGYVLTTTNIIPTYNVSLGGVQTIDARYSDNPPVYLQSKPTNNQFIVKITFHDGTLYTVLTAHYGLLLTFIAI